MKKALLISLLILVLVALVACEATPTPEPEVTSGDITPEAVDTTEHVHEYTDELKAPTCTEPGYFERKCSCGDVQRTDTSPKGHTYGAWEVLNAPTCNSDGKRTAAYTVCGEKTEEVSPRAKLLLTAKK